MFLVHIHYNTLFNLWIDFFVPYTRKDLGDGEHSQCSNPTTCQLPICESITLTFSVVNDQITLGRSSSLFCLIVFNNSFGFDDWFLLTWLLVTVQHRHIVLCGQYQNIAFVFFFPVFKLSCLEEPCKSASFRGKHLSLASWSCCDRWQLLRQIWQFLFFLWSVQLVSWPGCF